MIVAVDGPAGVGKSSVCKAVADELGIFYINSGNFYRVITFAHLRAEKDPVDSKALVETASKAQIGLLDGRITLDGLDVEDLLHSDAVDAWVAQNSAVVDVRHIVNDTIRSVVKTVDAVIEGRDIGTVVYPDADVKVYMDATVEVRAKRRYLQGTSGKSLVDLVESIQNRDDIDKNKQEGSLKIANGALYLDTSHLTIEEVCDTVVRKIRESISI